MKNWKLSLAAITVVLSGQTQAALHDRGNGMIYDDVLNITWLQDANYAQTSGYDADGLMTWQESLDWAEQLDYQGFTKWRLATAGTDPFTYYDSSDEHWHLYNINLNNPVYNSGCYPDCFTNVSFIDATTGLTTNFLNIQAGWYWYKETYLTPVGQIEYEMAWSFSYSEGAIKDPSFRTSSHYAWAVVDGDVGADTDNDGILDPDDNCPNIANPLQLDTDNDGIGNVCDPVDGYPLQPRLKGKAFYDPQTDLTWFTNANTSVESVNINGLTGWRLPHVNQNDPTCSDSTTFTDGNYLDVYDTGINCTGSDLGHLFYNVLGGIAGVSIVDTHNPNYNLFSNIKLDGGYKTDLIWYYAGNTAMEQSIFNLSSGLTGFIFQNTSPPYPVLYTWPVHTGDVHLSDDDGDGVGYINDNCPGIANPSQTDSNNDGVGDLCASDQDNDGVDDSLDNCPSLSNPDQTDVNNNEIGDACDPYILDTDNDGINDAADNCPQTSNTDQSDNDSDGLGDACDPYDGFPLLPRLEGKAFYDPQTNLTWLADANFAQGSIYDYYSDGTLWGFDARTWASNLNISGITGWRLPTNPYDSSCTPPYPYFNCTGGELSHMFYKVLGGTAQSSIVNIHNSNYNLFTNIQSGIYWSSPIEFDFYSERYQASAIDFNSGAWISQNADGIDVNYAWPVISGDVHLSDIDNDGVIYIDDNCPAMANPDQRDSNNNGVGDVCDSVVNDTDSDGVPDVSDNCPITANPNQKDSGGMDSKAADGIGDACQCGDISGDGKITNTDSVLIKRHLLGLPSKFDANFCDVSGDALCTNTDAVLIQRALLGLPPGLRQSCVAAGQ